MAFEAYTNWSKYNTDVRLPALPFDDLQLFFLGKCKCMRVQVGFLLEPLNCFSCLVKIRTNIQTNFQQLSKLITFFSGYALPWCARHTDKHSTHQILNDEHAPERFRVLGPLSNNPAFAKAFNCPVDSPMNPQQKCQIWQFLMNYYHDIHIQFILKLFKLYKNKGILKIK